MRAAIRRRGPVRLLLAGSLALAAQATATADGPDAWDVTGVPAGGVLDVRSEPHASAEKVGGIPDDARGLGNLGCRGVPSFAAWQRMDEAERKAAAASRWCRVRYGELEGWVPGRHLRESSGSGP